MIVHESMHPNSCSRTFGYVFAQLILPTSSTHLLITRPDCEMVGGLISIRSTIIHFNLLPTACRICLVDFKMDMFYSDSMSV